MEHKVLVSMRDGSFDRLWLRVDGVDYEIPKISIESEVIIREYHSIFKGEFLINGVKED